MQVEDFVLTAILLGCVQIILQCPPCPDSIISSNMNWGTYIKVNLKILCKHWLQGGICHLQSTNNTQNPEARRMQLTT
jgi:hypothetical protein